MAWAQVWYFLPGVGRGHNAIEVVEEASGVRSHAIPENMKNVWSSDYFFNRKKGGWGLRENCNTGHTSGKEYAELEWPFDLAIALVWVCFGIMFFGTIARRTIKPIL